VTATLLDVNVLIALAWPNHVHHRPARHWFDERSEGGWATTPVTELGFVRVSSNKKVIPAAVTPRAALGVLQRLCRIDGHEFWTDGCRLTDPPFDLDRLGSHRQVTDLHLAALAVEHGGTLATFDRGIKEALDPGQRHVIDLLLAGTG
jgi:toxin-antitoxin system PIN domain toxin